MSEVPEAVRQMAEHMAATVPQAAALGFRLVSVDVARGSIEVPWREDLVGDPDTQVIAGGVVTSLLDHTCGLAMAAAAGAEPFSTATLDLRIDYMRPAAPRTGVVAEAHCYKLTRTIGFVRAEAWDVDRGDLVATAQAAFVLTGQARMSLPAAELETFLQRVPYVRFLGMRAELAGDEMTAILPFSKHLVGNTFLPALHGGVIGAFLEMTALAQLSVAQPSPRVHKTIDITIEYLRPGRALTSYARADLRKVGRRIANVHVEAWQEDRSQPFAALRGHFLLSDGS